MKKHADKCLKTNCTCDGYHTFDELYDHRIALWILCCRLLQNETGLVWRSEIHHDGTSFDGWFILGFEMIKGEQITYHLPISKWDETNFATTHIQAPCSFDGHTSDDVLERIKKIKIKKVTHL